MSRMRDIGMMPQEPGLAGRKKVECVKDLPQMTPETAHEVDEIRSIENAKGRYALEPT